MIKSELAQEILALKPGAHLCLFYDQDPGEQLPALVPFIHEGLRQNEQFIYIADDYTVGQLSDQLERAGIDIQDEIARGRLKLWTRREWRQPGRLSSQAKSLQVRQFVKEAAEAGFAGVRFAVEMTWTLGPDISAHDLEHWEATLNTLFVPDFPARIICQYNRSRMTSEVMLAALHTHPLAILGNDVCPNLFYQAPLILTGDAKTNGGLSEYSNGNNSIARLDWMVSQLKHARNSERERIQERERHATDERFQRLVSVMPAGVYTCDAEGRISFFNKWAAKLWGAEPRLDHDSVRFLPFHKLYINGAPVDPEKSPVAESIREGKSFRDIEALVENSNGDTFAASLNVDPIPDAADHPIGAIVVFQDISRLKVAEEKYQHASAELTLQLADMQELHHLSTRLGGNRDLKSVLQEVLKAALEVFHAEMGLIALADPDGNLLASVTTGLPSRLVTDLEQFGIPRGSSHQSFATGSPYSITDIQTSTEFSELKTVGESNGIRAAHSTPLIVRDGNVIGVLTAYFARPHQPTERETRMVELYARHAADAIESARLREQTEKALQKELELQTDSATANRKLASIVECSDDAIISKDLNGIIRSWNGGAQRIFGYTADEAVGQSVTMLIPADRINEEPEILARLRKGERVDHYETVRRRKDGRLVDISLTVSPIKDDKGRIIGASKIARDITGRKRSEVQQAALFDFAMTMNRAEDLEKIFAVSLDAISRAQQADRAAILLYDEKGVMRFRAWRNLSAEYRAAVEGHSPWNRDDRDPQPIWIENVSEAGLDPNLCAVVQKEGIAALGFIPITYERVLLGKFMVYFNSPRVFQPAEWQPAQTIASQIAFAVERRKAGHALETLVRQRTDSLREAISQMEEFSYSVSHDLRAPVRAMQGYARAVLEDYGERLDGQGQEYLERIVRNGSRMDRLIQDILIYSRLSRREIEFNTVDLDRLVREIVQQYPEMHWRQADIQINDRLASVRGHEPSLTQAISNLLNNAVKFVAAGVTPKIRLWTENNNGHVRLWIEDNGIGIKPEHQRRLFGMFERVHPDQNFDGTGIGLAIVRKAVERMGGKAGLESDGVRGSRFWIQLPAAESQ